PDRWDRPLRAPAAAAGPVRRRPARLRPGVGGGRHPRHGLRADPGGAGRGEPGPGRRRGGELSARTLAVVVVALVVRSVLQRLALAAEARGWIHYRRRGGGGAAAAALQALNTVVDPAREHQVVEERRVRREDDESGDPPV